LELVVFTLPKLTSTLEVLERFRETSFNGEVAAIVRYSDEVQALEDAGAATVFNIYTESGVGFATHVAN
jgi:glutathione-regulated potassium-efflux system ancillary protein KefC